MNLVRLLDEQPKGLIVSVDVVSTGNVELQGWQVVDGIWPPRGTRVLVLLTCQTDPWENGVWLMSEGYWIRVDQSIIYKSNAGSCFGETFWMEQP